MKATEHFKQTIKAYLDERAQNDELFAVSYAKENKNMDDCVTFILNQVKRSKCMGLTDEEVYSLAVHFFDEDDIEIGNPIACNVIVNHTVELTEEEKAAKIQGTEAEDFLNSLNFIIEYLTDTAEDKNTNNKQCA